MNDEKQIENGVPAEVSDGKKKKEPPKKNKKAVGLFKKKYKPDQIEKKLYSRIYVEADREFVKTLFIETEDKKGRTWLAVPKETRFTKKEFARLKQISADVKSQKGRVKLFALLLTAAVIAAVIILFSMFKNVLVKKAIVSGGSAAFGAVCDVREVSFQPLKGYLSIKGLEIADKDNPWKNLVEIDTITSDFDLTMLLQGKFIVEDMSVTGIQAGTDRDTDGTYIPKEKKKKEKKQKKPKEKSAEPSKFTLMAQELSAEMTSRFMSAVDGLFDQYDPEKMINQFYSQLTLPETVQGAIDFGTDLTASLMAEASSLEKTAASIKTSVDEVMNFDYDAVLNNPLLLKDMYDLAVETYDVASDAYEEATDAVEMIKKAADDVQAEYAALTDAYDADSVFLKDQVSDLKRLNVSDGFSFLVDTSSDLVQKTLGEVYDYLKIGLEYIQTLKENKPAEKEKKKPAERSKGRTVVYRNHNEPTFWIRHVEGSGPKLQFTATNISSDEVAAGGPAVLDFNGRSLDFYLGASGGPGLQASAAFDLVTTIHDTGSYEVKGNVSFNPFILSAGTFEPKVASTIVNSVFSRFDATSAGFTAQSAGFGKKMDFNFETDMGDILWNAVQDEWNEQLEAVKARVLEEAQSKLQEYVNSAVESLTGFSDLETAIAGYTEIIENYKNMIEAKKNEIYGYVNGTIDAVKGQTEAAVKAAQAEAERLKAEAEAKAKELETQAQAAAEAAKAEAERLAKEAEEAAQAEAERLKKEAEAAARAEAERLKKEAEEAAKKAAEDAAKKAAEEAAKAFKKLW